MTAKNWSIGDLAVGNMKKKHWLKLCSSTICYWHYLCFTKIKWASHFTMLFQRKQQTIEKWWLHNTSNEQQNMKLKWKYELYFRASKNCSATDDQSSLCPDLLHCLLQFGMWWTSYTVITLSAFYDRAASLKRFTLFLPQFQIFSLLIACPQVLQSRFTWKEVG